MPNGCFWIEKQGGDRLYLPNSAFESVRPERKTDARRSTSERGTDTGGNLATGGEVARWAAVEADLSMTTAEVGDLYQLQALAGIGPYFVGMVRDLALSGWTESTPVWLILTEATQTAPNLWRVSLKMESL